MFRYSHFSSFTYVTKTFLRGFAAADKVNVAVGPKFWQCLAPAVGQGRRTLHLCSGRVQKFSSSSSASSLANSDRSAKLSGADDVGKQEVLNKGTDGVGESDVVYVGTMARMVRFVKLFSLSTSAVGLSLQPLIYQHVSSLPPLVAAAVGGFAGFFVFVTPLLLHLVTKRYVVKITLDQNTGEFTAVTYSLFLREKLHRFTPSQVSVPRVPGLFTTICVNGKVPLFIDPNLFLDRQALIYLLKYDEPLDWKLETSDNKEPGEQKHKQKP